ncbi:MAG: hypothetical protein EXR95_03670 [Gemmatimonadetes bacterium]|nr:hypothetical protein [Gemmatimonadota bacterium]
MLLIAAALAATGCASGGKPNVYRQAGQGQYIQVTVENQNFKDATVYAVWGAGNRDRLGLVTGNTTQTFTVPWKQGDMRVQVDFIAGDDTVTESMGVNRGDHLQVTIPPSAQ